MKNIKHNIVNKNEPLAIYIEINGNKVLSVTICNFKIVFIRTQFFWNRRKSIKNQLKLITEDALEIEKNDGKEFRVAVPLIKTDIDD